MERPALNDKEKYPSEEILRATLRESYLAYRSFMEVILNPSQGIMPQWNYYQDGKSWLCKGVFKKKTVFWLSVWDGYFKISFYFSEKTKSGVLGLNIKESLKADFEKTGFTGKLKSLSIIVQDTNLIKDIMTLIEYKKRC